MAQRYRIEVTDTYGGEANYCWVRRHSVLARSPIHALHLSEGGYWRKAWDSGDCVRYNLKNAHICAFVEVEHAN